MGHRHTTEWMYIAIKYGPDGSILNQIYEIFETTFSDFDVMSLIAPAIRQEVFVNERGFKEEDIKLYKIFQAPIGITEDDDLP